ncbi:MAG: GNAT family N-acetyltransferase [Pikeienuella sp.]
MISTRLAVPEDAPALVGVLNPIIKRGGTTAYEDEISVEAMAAMLTGLIQPSFCHVAEDAGRILGYQTCKLVDYLPPNIGDMASFVAVEAVGRGIGRALATATFAQAKVNGFTELNATIRADNKSGLTYYNSIGFVDHSVNPAKPLKYGPPVDRISKRLSLP